MTIREGLADIINGELKEQIGEVEEQAPKAKVPEVSEEVNNKPVATEEPKEEVVDEAPKSEKRTFQSKINQVVARAKTAESDNANLKQQLKDAEEKLALAMKINQTHEDPYDNLDDVDTDSNNTYITKDQLSEVLAQTIGDLQESVQQKSVEDQLESKRIEFASILEGQYTDRYDKELETLDDAALKEATSVYEVFNSNPDKWLDYVKTNGADTMIAFVNGNLKPGKTVDDVLEKQQQIFTETQSSGGSLTGEDTTKKRTLRDIISSGVQKTVKKG